jgi:hypothetical protein
VFVRVEGRKQRMILSHEMKGKKKGGVCHVYTHKRRIYT